MLSVQMMPASNPKLDDLLLPSPLDSSQLNQIATELDLVAIAISALTRIERVEMRQVAQALQVESLLSNWIDKWSSAGFASSKQLDLDRLRALILTIVRLAQTHQAVIRQNVNYWHQTVQSEQLPLQAPALADYLNNFLTLYQAQMGSEASRSIEALSTAALTLLVELLFYSGATGHLRLWAALLQRAQSIGE